MLRLTPRIGVALLVTLLFGPLNSTAHDSDDKNSEGTWAVIVEGHTRWTGEDHRDCEHRARETGGRCVHKEPHRGESKQYYCPEVTPGLTAHCYRADVDNDRLTPGLKRQD